MDSIVQPKALMATLRATLRAALEAPLIAFWHDLREKLSGNSLSRGRDAPAHSTGLVVGPLPSSHPLDAHKAEARLEAAQEPNDDGKPGITAKMSDPFSSDESGLTSSSLTVPTFPVRVASPASCESGCDENAFASVFRLGDERVIEPPGKPRDDFQCDLHLSSLIDDLADLRTWSETAQKNTYLHADSSPIDLIGLEELHRELKLLDEHVPALDTVASRQAKFRLNDMNGLKVIKGIGPKVVAVLNDAGIHSFSDLAECTPQGLRNVLDRAGTQLPQAQPALWIEQARLAADNRWQALREWQETHGKRHRRAASAGMTAISPNKTTAV